MKPETLDAVLAIALLALLAGVLGLLAFVKIPSANLQLFTALSAGTVGAGVGAVVGYRFGSSKGSAAKDETIRKLTPGAGADQ